MSLELVIAEDGRVYDRFAIKDCFHATTADRVPSPSTGELMQHKGTVQVLIENGVMQGDLVAKWNAKVKQKKAMVELQEKAEKGDVQAMYDLGMNYYTGQNGFPEDEKLAYFWFKKAHNAGNAKAISYVAYMLVHGCGVAENRLQGLTYLGVAAKESELAAYGLGMAFANGHYGLPTDTAEARRLLELVVNGSCTHAHLDESCDPLLEKAKAKPEELKIRQIGGAGKEKVSAH